jgi:hypothetical protein
LGRNRSEQQRQPRYGVQPRTDAVRRTGHRNGATREGEAPRRAPAQAGGGADGGKTNGSGSRSRTDRLGGRSGGDATEGRFGVLTSEANREPAARNLAPRVRTGRPSGRSERAPKRGAGKQTPRACVVETHHRARGGVNRQGREKRRRRTEAGVETRDEARREGGGFGQSNNVTPGSGFPGLGASKGRRTLREDGREQGTALAGRSGSANRDADEVLKGERKARSGIQDRTGNRPVGDSTEHAKVQPAREKGAGDAVNPSQAATAGRHTLKVDATPQRVGTPRTR